MLGEASGSHEKRKRQQGDPAESRQPGATRRSAGREGRDQSDEQRENRRPLPAVHPCTQHLRHSGEAVEAVGGDHCQPHRGEHPAGEMPVASEHDQTTQGGVDRKGGRRERGFGAAGDQLGDDESNGCQHKCAKADAARPRSAGSHEASIVAEAPLRDR